MMKSKLVQFSIEQLMHLKGLLNYLRNHENRVSAGESEMGELEIKTNFQFILKKMERLLREGESARILQFVAAGIDRHDFLSSYYYASLVKDLAQKPLNSQLHQLTLATISKSLRDLDSQRSICWSRFLGELYNYEIISRKKLIEDLAQLLQNHQAASTLSSCLKCICATLETAKFYLKDSELSRDGQEVLTLLLDVKVTPFILRKWSASTASTSCSTTKSLRSPSTSTPTCRSWTHWKASTTC
jgi:hypothetical protein